MKAGFLQFAPSRLDPAGNVSRIASMLRDRRDCIVVTPELALTGYLFRNRKSVADNSIMPDSPALSPLFDVLRERNIMLALGFAEKAERGSYNSLMLAGPSGPEAVYRKIHLFDREKLLFLPGEEPPPVVEAFGAKLGLMICWDWYFPEFARCLGRKGAQVILHAANLVLPWCMDAMKTRSLENRIFSITANRTGTEEERWVKLEFYGRSQVVDPNGERVIAAGGNGVEGVFIADIDPARADLKAMTPRNPGPSEARVDLLGC